MKDKIIETFSSRPKPISCPKLLHTTHSDFETINSLRLCCWEDLTESIVTRLVFCWSSFDREFVNYYLPGIMLFIIKNPRKTFMVVDDIIFDLLGQENINGLGYEFIQRWGGLSVKELEVFETWLNKIKNYYSNYNYDHVFATIFKLKNRASGESVSKPILL